MLTESLKMNNYPFSSHSRPLFPAYRDSRHDISSDRYFGLQDRGQVFHQHNMQSSRLPVEQRMPLPYRSRLGPAALEVDSLRSLMSSRYDEQVSQSRFGRESSQYDRIRDHSASIALNSLPSERDVLTAGFSNTSLLHGSPRSNLCNNSSSGFQASAQRNVQLHSFGNMPNTDSTLRERYRNHLQQQISQQNASLQRSNSHYQNDYSFSPTGVSEQERLYSNLQPSQNQQSFDRDYKSIQNEVENSKSTAMYNEDSLSALQKRDRLYSNLPPSQNNQLSFDRDYKSIQNEVESSKSAVMFNVDSLSALETQDRLYSNLPPPQNNQQSVDREYESIQNKVENFKNTAMYDNSLPALDSLSAEDSLSALEKTLLFSNIENLEQKSREFYDESKDLHALRNSPQSTDRFNQIKVPFVSKQNSNVSSRNESFESLEHVSLDNKDLPIYSDTLIGTEKHETDSKNSTAFQFDVKKRNLLANQSVFETNSQSPVKEIAGSLSFSAAQSPGFKNKNDLQAPSNLKRNLPENSSLPEVTNRPKNSFLSKNSDSEDVSMKPSGEDSLHIPEVATKSNSCDNSLSTDDWPSSHSIPFLGETTEEMPGQPLSLKSSPTEQFSTQIQEKSDDDSMLSSSSLNKSGEDKKIKSTLEDALETLMIKEPVVGLDYIIEYKDIVFINGGFPFHCELCNSSISRSLIIEHIQGFKHRLKYLKLKDETSCDFIVDKLTKQSEKDEYVYNASERLEKTHGRGNVIVKLGPPDTKKPLQIRFGKIVDNILCSPVSNQEEHLSSEPFTIVKEEKFTCRKNSDDSLFRDEHHSSSLSSNTTHKNESNVEAKDNAILSIYTKETSKLSFPEKSAKPDIIEHNTNEKESNQPDLDLIANQSPTSSSETLRRPASPSWYGQAKKLKQEASGDLNVLHADPMLYSNKNEIDDSQKNAASSSAQLFNPMVFEQLFKCVISTDDEANTVLKVISALMKQLLRYKLQHIASEDVENLMTSVHSSESVDKILDLIKDKTSKFQMDKNEKLTSNSDFSVKGKEILGFNTPLDSQTINCPSSEVEELTKDTQTLKCSENLNLTASSSSNPLCSNEVQMNSQINIKPQSMNASWLQPPPFFQWPDPNTVSTSSVSTAVTGSPLQNSGMAWSSAYQMQLAAMSFYQQHGYGTGSAMYQGTPVPQHIPMAPVDASFLKLPLPTNEAFVPPPPANSAPKPPPPANPLPTPPPPPPANPLPTLPPPPPANPLPTPPPPPPANPLPTPPPPPPAYPLPRPPLPPAGSPLPPCNSPSKKLLVPPPPPVFGPSLHPPLFSSLPKP